MNAATLPRIDLPPPDAPPPDAPERRTLWSATAALLQSQQEGPALRATARRFQAPLSYSQERLWFLQQADRRSAAYNIPFAWRILGRLNIPALEAALNRIVRRHTIFQTRFEEADGVPVQVADRIPSISVTTDLVTIEEFAAEPFDLSTPPLVRANVLVCGEEEFYLTVVVHHIIFDGWSRGLFLRELNAEYASALSGMAGNIPEPPLQYLDYAAWHREWLEGDVTRQQMAYWRSQLAAPADGPDRRGALLQGTELPSDRPRTAAGQGSGAALFFSLPPALHRGVERLRKEQMTTRFVVLLAAFKALLHRYTGDQEIVIGSVAANRNRAEIRNVVGCFINTLVLRTHVSSGMRFRDLLSAVEETARGAFANQEVPFERIVAELKPERSRNRSPLFQIMFALQNGAAADLRLAGTRTRSIPVHNGCAKFDLSIEISDQPGRVSACIEYNTALFDRGTVHRMARNFAVLLQGAIEHPDQPLRDLPLLSRSEERQLLISCNATETDYPRDRCVADLFGEVARRTPSAVALADGVEEWTYAELDARSAMITAELRRLGVKKGTIVALAAMRRPDAIAAMLGILKAGGAYMPIDSAAPPQRIAFLIEDSGARIAVAHQELLHTLPKGNVQVVCIEDVLRAGGRDSSNATSKSHETDSMAATLAFSGHSGSSADDPAYVLYTSGSTGTPKGVCVPHRAIVRLVRNTNYIALSEDDVVGQAASLAFDAATFEIWGALLNGARLEFLPQEAVLVPTELAKRLRARRVTTLFLTTSVFNLVAAEAPTAFAPLRNVLFGGEVADPAAVRAVLTHGRPMRLINAYGPTETTTFATWHQVENVAADAATVPIGIPISNTQVHILDTDGNLAPLGARGEVYIGGDGVALGYMGRPELTAQKFVERAIGPGGRLQRLYRTGDFAVRRADSVIEFAGRVDDQVKLRGFRIELPEIEFVLRQHPEVRECCLVLRQNASAGKQLVAYVVAATPTEPPPAREMRAWVGARLPDYMVPAVFVFLAQLPLNGNGKVDRSALPEPGTAVVENTCTMPWIPLHVQIIEIWEELLQVKPVGLRDDFFALGGHSLLAVRLMDRLEQACGRRLPVSTLFSHATVEKLANAILESDITPPPIVEVQPGGSRTPLFFLHGDLFGGGLYCRQLARELGPAQPFFVMPPCRASATEPVPRVESMAAAHLKTIRRHFPHGPYMLGGFCVSALVALEMARQLQSEGERVEMLIMLDPPAPRSLWWVRRWVEVGTARGRQRERECVARFSRAFNRVYRARELGSQGSVQQIRWLRGVFSRRHVAASAQPEVTPDSAAGAYLWATAGYRPARYSGNAVVISCDSVMGSGRSRSSRWSRYLTRLESHTLDCQHLELVTRHSAEVAALIDRCLSLQKEFKQREGMIPNQLFAPAAGSLAVLSPCIAPVGEKGASPVGNTTSTAK